MSIGQMGLLGPICPIGLSKTHSYRTLREPSMPHTASAWKRLRKNEKRKKQNRAVAKTIKLKRKASAVALKDGDAAKLTETFKVTQEVLDRAADRGYIH